MNAIQDALHISSLEGDFNYAVIKLARAQDPQTIPALTAIRDRTRAAYLAARVLS